MRAMQLFFLCALLSGCDYRETVGETGGGGGGGGDGGTDAGTMSCESFQIPSGDCTLGQGSCTFDMDCPGLNQTCNLQTRRCFSDAQICVGTPCGFDEDCPSSERCNQTAKICFELAADQRCMPCFVLDQDCGTGTCDTDRSLCL